MKVLITSTSFADTKGPHHELLESQRWDVAFARGPLTEAEMLELVGDYDGIICGDDVYTRAVLEKSLPKLRCLSKYGIGIDKIEVNAATDLGIPICNTPGVNHEAVAEHTFSLLLALAKNLTAEVNLTRVGKWKRLIGHELSGKTIGIMGMGRIGKEVIKRAKGFNLSPIACDPYWDEAFASEHGVKRCADFEELVSRANIISLHTFLTDETREMVNRAALAKAQDGVYILNCARGELIDNDAILDALKTGKVGGYGADVLDIEPPPAEHPLLTTDLNCIVTPHIASRTYESVARQGSAAIENLSRVLRGEPAVTQVNLKKS